MIPKILWQTYKTEYPPEQARESIKSWLTLNPDYEWCYMDDHACGQFIFDHFSEEFYQMYTALPLGVMRADVWRVCVVYIYGGIYSDTDTKCLRPAAEWINPEHDLVVCVETEWGALANFTFAAAPRHPALYSVLETFLRYYNSPGYLNTDDGVPVQNFGANAFVIGILGHYNLTEHMNQGAAYYNTVDKVKEEKAYFYPYLSRAFSPVVSPDTYVYHQTASVFWTGEYQSWRVQQKELFGV